MSPDRMGPVDHGSVLSRLRDWAVRMHSDLPRELWTDEPREFVDAMDGGDALLVPLREAPLADDELLALGAALGDDIVVLRTPASKALAELGGARGWVDRGWLTWHDDDGSVCLHGGGTEPVVRFPLDRLAPMVRVLLAAALDQAVEG